MHYGQHVALKDNRDEELEKNKPHYEEIAQEEQRGEGPVPATHCLVPSLHIVLVAWVLDALIVDLAGPHES